MEINGNKAEIRTRRLRILMAPLIIVRDLRRRTETDYCVTVAW